MLVISREMMSQLIAVLNSVNNYFIYITVNHQHYGTLCFFHKKIVLILSIFVNEIISEIIQSNLLVQGTKLCSEDINRILQFIFRSTLSGTIEFGGPWGHSGSLFPTKMCCYYVLL